MNTIISEDVIPCVELEKKLANPKAGALVTFQGLVRNHNHDRGVRKLEYQCYASMCMKIIDHLVEAAMAQYPVYDILVQHRSGEIPIGECAVWIGVSGAHRKACFDACQYVIDELKVSAPIWKKESYEDGKSEWVFCHECSSHI